MAQSIEINLAPIQSCFQHSLEVQCVNTMHKTYTAELETRILKMEKKLEKKNQLIKYLQRKCGYQIIKTTKKLQEQISRLETENSSLKNNDNSSLNCKARPNQCDKQELTLCSQFSHAILASPFKQQLNKHDIYWQKLLQFSIQQLRQIILVQSCELQILRNAQQNCPTPLQCRQNKRLKSSMSKKNPPTSRRTHLKGNSNQNLNKLNLESCLKENSLHLNLQNESISLMSSRQLYQGPPKPSISTQQQSSQTCTSDVGQQLVGICIQTQETMKEIEYNQMENIDLRIQNGILRKEVENMLVENRSLKEEAIYFEEKVRDYYRQYEQVQVIADEQMPSQPGEQLPQIPAFYNQLCQNYRQVLQIFGIEWKELKDEYENDKEHQKLLHEICNVKLQITHLLKEFKKLQKELVEAVARNRQLQCHIKYKQADLTRVDEYTHQLTLALAELNDELMAVRANEMHLKYLVKHQSQRNLEAQVFDSQLPSKQLDIESEEMPNYQTKIITSSDHQNEVVLIF